MATTRAVWGWVTVLALGAAACGGSAFQDLGDAGSDGGGGGGGGGGDGGSTSDGGGSGGGGDSGGGGGGVCPATPPMAGASCTKDGLDCEYGDNPDPSCNEIAQCSGGTWTLTPHQSCPPASTCPSSFGGVPQGQKCTPNGEACPYEKGTCYCTNAGPATSTDPRWVCVQTPQGCPSTRPDIGSSCTTPGQSCDYGACVGGAALECKDGYWQRVNTPCPV